MGIMFEVKCKDYLGRIGKIKIGDKRLETPAFIPVYNFGKINISLKYFKKLGIEAIITNSYFLYKNYREEVLEKGVHEFLGFDGIIFTDSGAYQLMRFGEIDVDNREIIEFQREIGSDVGVILDLPITLEDSFRIAKEKVEETIKRAYEGREYLKDIELIYPIHGGKYKTLLKRSAEFGIKMGYNFFGLGSVVPETVTYSFSLIIRNLKIVRKIIRWNPIHVFGAGHPMFFPLLVLFGADTFDSASYAIFALDNRVITPYGTKRLEELDYLPTSHSYWQDYTPKELLTMPKGERVRALAEINLYECILEIKRIKQAIREGRLFEYAYYRCLSNPYLLEAIRRNFEYSLFEENCPFSKMKGFLYQGKISYYRPEIQRHFRRLLSIKKFKVAIVLPEVDDRPYTDHPFFSYVKERLGLDFNVKANVFFFSSLLSLVPLEISWVYPMTQIVYPYRIERKIVEANLRFAKSFLENFEEVYIFNPNLIVDRFGRRVENYYREFLRKLPGKEIKSYKELREVLESLEKFDDIEKFSIVQAIRYQFEVDFEDDYENYELIRSTQGRVRLVRKNGKTYLTIRLADGKILPKEDLGKKLFKFYKYPRKRIVLNWDAIEYVKKTRSVLAPGVKFADENIIPEEVVFIVDPDDNLVGIGVSKLSGKEINQAKKGVVAEMIAKGL